MTWDARLEGGPADGDTAQCRGPLPAQVYATYCEGCREWHWFSTPQSGGEVYDHADEENDIKERRAKYVYADIRVPGHEDSEHGRRPRELVPA